MAADDFKGLPMRELIGAPLQAACESQQKLAESALDYMLRIGFEEGDLQRARLVKFNLERPVETPDGITTSTIEVQAPFLGLVPIPSLLIESVDVDFQMEVTSTATSKENTNAEVATRAGYKGLFSRVSVDVQGKVSSSRENTRSTNQTAKYQVHVSARQQRPTEGLSRLMDILASCTAPLSVTPNGKNTPADADKEDGAGDADNTGGATDKKDNKKG